MGASPTTVECMKSTEPVLRQQCGLTGLKMRGIDWPGDIDQHPDRVTLRGRVKGYSNVGYLNVGGHKTVGSFE